METKRVVEASNIKFNAELNQTTYTQTEYELAVDGSKHVLTQGNVILDGELSIDEVMINERARSIDVSPDVISEVVYSEETTLLEPTI